jgi:hypothetical protein
MAGAAMALLGCGKPAPRPRLLHHAMVARLEVVAEDAGSHNPEMELKPDDTDSPPYVAHLGRETPSNPGNDWWQGGARGATHYVVLDEIRRWRRFGLGSHNEPPITVIRTFDAQGEPAGTLDTRSVAPEERVAEVAAEWDEARLRVGVWIRTESAGYVGVVDPPSAEFESIVRVEGVADPIRPAHVLWRGNALIVCYEAEGANVVMEAETGSGDARRVLVEETWDPSLSPLDRAYLSPDRRFLACDRYRSPHLMRMGGTCSGIWLLDLESGEWVELTYEDVPDYRHRLLGWEGPDTLLFTRRVAEERPTPSHGGYLHPVYRAHLAAPEEG